MLVDYFGLRYENWGKDAHAGEYAFIDRNRGEGTAPGAPKVVAMIPLYGFLEGDTLGLLMLAQPEDYARGAGAAAVRRGAHARRPRPARGHRGRRRRVSTRASAWAKANFLPLQRFDVRRRDSSDQ